MVITLKMEEFVLNLIHISFYRGSTTIKFVNSWMISLYVYWKIRIVSETIYYQCAISGYFIRMVQMLCHLQFHHFILFVMMDVKFYKKSVVYRFILYSIKFRILIIYISVYNISSSSY